MLLAQSFGAIALLSPAAELLHRKNRYHRFQYALFSKSGAGHFLAFK